MYSRRRETHPHLTTGIPSMSGKTNKRASNATRKAALEQLQASGKSYRRPETARLDRVLSPRANLSWEDVLSIADTIRSQDPRRIAEKAIRHGREVYDIAKRGINTVKSYFTGSNARIVDKLIEKEIPKKEVERSSVMTGTPHVVNKVKAPRVRSSATGSESFGTDLVATLTATQDYKVGDVIFSLLISPSTLPRRIREIASKWELYDLAGHFELQGSCGTTIAGQTVGYVDYDPTDTVLSNNSNNVTVATGHEGAKIGSLYEGWKVDIKKSNEAKRLYVDNDTDSERWTAVGRLYIVCSQPIANGSQLGTLTLNWRMINRIPQLETSVSGGDSWVMAGSGSMGTTDYFGSATHPMKDSIDAIAETKTGTITLPAGIYRINAFVGGGNTLAITTASGLSVHQTASRAPLVWPQYGWYVLNEAKTVLSTSMLCACSTGFAVTLDLTGTWTGLQITINGQFSSPVSSSFRTLCGLLEKARSATLQMEKVEQVRLAQSGSDSKEVKERLRKDSVDESYVPIPSSSSNSGSSSSSSISATPLGKFTQLGTRRS